MPIPNVRPTSPRAPAVGRLLLVLIFGAGAAAVFAFSAHLAFAALFGGASGLAATASPPWQRLLSTFNLGLLIGAIGIAFLLAAALVYQRQPSRLLSAAPRFRWSMLLKGFAIFAALQILAIGISVGIGSVFVGTLPGMTVRDWVLLCVFALLVCTPFVIGEEIMVRAWLVRAEPSFNRRTVTLVLISSMIFAALHLTLEPLRVAMHLISGLAYAWAVIRLCGLEFAIGAHLGRNTIVEILMTAPDRRLSPGALETALAANIAASLVLILIVEVIARRKSWQV
jgi:uncharacterized protein